MHKYVRKESIKKDIDELSKNNIIKKCKDYKFCKDFVKEIAIKNRLFNTKPSILEKFIISNYGNLNLNYNLISSVEKEKKISTYKKINEIDANTDINIEKAINLKIICNSVSQYIKNYNKINQTLDNLLCNMTYNHDKIVQTSIVKFIRKGITYKKKIYYIMINTMKDALKTNIDKRNQFFLDITYYAIPINNNNYKLCVIMAKIKKIK